MIYFEFSFSIYSRNSTKLHFTLSPILQMAQKTTTKGIFYLVVYLMPQNKHKIIDNLK